MSAQLLTSKEEIKQFLLEILNEEEPMGDPRFPNHQEAVEPWKRSLEQGTFNGRPFAKHTVDYYKYYVDGFLKKYGEVSYEHLEAELLEIPIELFGKRDKFYRAILCLGKYLVRENCLPKSFLKKARALQPKRHRPPKQSSLNEEQLNSLLQACENSYEKLIVTLLSSTGLRASEFCSLKREDLYLEEGYLVVQNGKWGKRRRVGLNNDVIGMLKQHLKAFHIESPAEHVFLDAKLQPLVRDGLLNRLYRIGKRAGVHVSPHMLRRAFVTLNANKGRSLVMLQMACGHSDIKTTRSYCQTTEEEVIEAMKGWN